MSFGRPATTYRSEAHAPRSISLQRSEQNGLKALSLVHGVCASHVGHFTIVIGDQKAQSASSNGISRSTDRGLRSRSWVMNRIHSMYLFALISGIALSEPSTRTCRSA